MTSDREQLRLTRPDIIDPERVRRIHEAAVAVLERVGLAVLQPRARRLLAGAGFRVDGERVFFRPEAVEDFVADHRRRHAGAPAEAGRRIRLRVNQYSHHVHDLELDEIVPYTTAKLAEMARFAATYAGEDVEAAAPGYPLDVPAPLQPVMQYFIGATSSAFGATPVDPMTVFAGRFVFEMAEVMERPVRDLPLYVFSPLRLGGESLDFVVHYLDRLERIEVSSMPSAGATAPLEPFAAHVLAVAENLGGAVAIAAISGKVVDFWVGLHPFDLRTGSMVMGSPEAQLWAMAGADVNAYYSGSRRRGPSSIYTRANWPGPQATAEKASVMTTGALLGTRFFMTPGTLALDEVFSPEQFITDVEVRDHVQRLTDGLDFHEERYDAVAEIAAGVEATFVGLDSTLDLYRGAIWHPAVFDRGFLAGKERDGRRRQLQQARAIVRERLAHHDFELEPAKCREMERLWQAAVQAYGQGEPAPAAPPGR